MSSQELKNLKFSVITLEKKIANIELELTKFEDKLNQVNLDKLKELEEKVDELEDLISVITLGLKEIKDSSQEKSKTLEEKIKGLETTLTTLDSSIKELRNKLFTFLTKELEKVNEKNDDLKKRIDSLSNTVRMIKKEIELTDVSTFLEQLSKLTDKLSTMESKVEQLFTASDVSTVLKEFDLIESKIKEMKKKIVENAMNIQQIQNQLTALQTTGFGISDKRIIDSLSRAMRLNIERAKHIREEV